MNRHRHTWRQCILAALLALVTLAAAPSQAQVFAAPAHRAAADAPPAIVKGKKTTWQVSLLRTRSMYQIPGTTWRGYRGNFYRFFVLTLRLTDTGGQAIAPADDLTLTLRVRPPYLPHQQGYLAGFTILDRTDKVLVGMMRTAAHLYGGETPWTVASPGHTLTYCYVIGTNRGDSHYGLYNFQTRKAPQYLFDTGL